MNKLFLITALLLYNKSVETDLKVNLSASVIVWKGTKLRGSGTHEGTLKFRSGILKVRDGRPFGGKMEIDLNSMQVTDIPVSDPIPRANLVSHLREEFDVVHFPYAGFLLTSSTIGSITGNLTIMGKTAQITFPYKRTKNGFTGQVDISKRKWGIGENANWLVKNLVDDTIRLTVILVLET